MSKEAEALLGRLRDGRLVDPGRLKELSARVKAKPDRYDAAGIAERLKKSGDLTPYQAMRLVEEVNTGDEEIVDLAGGTEVVDLESGAAVTADPFAGDPFAAGGDALGGDALGGLGGDPFSAGGMGGMDAGSPNGAAEAAPKRERRKKVRRNQWESPLLLLGSGGLALLLIAGGFLIFVLLRGSETEMFDAAEAAYRAESYNQAIQLSDRYLTSFPTGQFASQARVMQKMAVIRQKSVAGRDMTDALKSAEEILPTIKTEPAFDDEVRGELSTILPSIAEGFSLQAVNAKSTTDSQKFVDLADEAMQLVGESEYIPRAYLEQQAPRIAAIEENLKLARRTIERDRRLTDAEQRIVSLSDDGKIDQAYSVRRELVRDYPGLATHERLIAAVAAIIAKEQELVQVQPSTLVSVAAPAPSDGATVFSLSKIEGKPVENPVGGVYVAYGRHAAYGIESATGQPVWRKFLGAGDERYPVEIPSSDATLLSDLDRHAILSVKRSDGEVAWRTPIGERFSQPTLFGDVALVATETGKLHSIGLADGVPRSMAQFAQPLSAAPGFDEQRPLLYQCGRQTNLYVLNADSLACREVYYLGHKAGSIGAPPAVMRGYVFVAENAGADYSFLHVLKTGNSGLGLEKAQEPIRIGGHVNAPMQIYDRRLVVISDSGEIAFFEVDPAAKNAPIKATTKFTASQRDQARPWSLIYSGTLFVAERRITRYDVQTARGQLNRSWIKYEGDVFTGPLTQAGAAAVAFPHRQAGLPGQTITAVDDKSGDPVWRCDVGYGALALFDAERTGASQPLLFSAMGQAFAFPDWESAPAFPQQTTDAGVGARGSSFDQAFVRSDRVVVLYGKNNPELAAVYQQGKDPVMRIVRFGIRNGKPTADSILWRDSLIVPWSGGQLFALDPTSGSDAAKPFQPTLKPDQTIEWVRPAPSPGDPATLFAAERQGAVYRVVWQEGASPFLKETVAGKVDGEIAGPLAAIGVVVAVAVRQGNESRVELLSESTLKSAKTVPMRAGISAGPFAAGDVVVTLLASGNAVAIDAAGAIRWETSVPAERLAGDPLLVDGKLYLAFASGDLVVLDSESGAVANERKWDEGFARLIAVRDGKLLGVSAEGAGVVLDLAAPAVEPERTVDAREPTSAAVTEAAADSVAEVAAE